MDNSGFTTDEFELLTLRARELGYDSTDAFLGALLHDDLVSKANADEALRALAKLTPEESEALTVELLRSASTRLNMEHRPGNKAGFEI